jgi:hypothetical protein
VNLDGFQYLAFLFDLCSNARVEDGDDSEETRPWRRLDAAAKAAVIDGLTAGARVVDLARAQRVTVQAFRNARRRDPLFDAAWRAAHAASAEAERREAREARAAWLRGEGEQSEAGDRCAGEGGHVQVHVPGDGPGETRIACNNRRAFQRRRLRHVRFDAKRQAAFLAHFCWSCDALAAAVEAGVSEGTVYRHLRGDGAFAAEFRAALEQGYVRLEAEAVRQRLAAQKGLRAAIEGSEPGAGAGSFAGDGLAGEFERVMKLLARWDRRHGGPGMQVKTPSATRAWTFDEAIAALEKRLTALGFIKPGEGPGPQAGKKVDAGSSPA